MNQITQKNEIIEYDREGKIVEATHEDQSTADYQRTPGRRSYGSRNGGNRGDGGSGWKYFFRFLTVLVIAVAVTIPILSCSKAVYNNTPAAMGDRLADRVENFFRDGFTPSIEQQITVYQVKNALEDIGELATYKYEYTDYQDVEESKKILWDLIDLSSTMKLQYSGTIKAGYDLDDVDVKVSNELKAIIVSLPDKAKILDNYIDLNSVQVVEAKENIFNQFDHDSVVDYLENSEEAALEKATADGIYEKAEAHLKEIIETKLEEFEYKILFL